MPVFERDFKWPLFAATLSTLGSCASSAAAPSWFSARRRENRAGFGAADDVRDRAGVEQFALLDDADRVTQIRKLRKDVRADQDRLAQPSKLFEQLAHFDAARGSRLPAGSSSRSTLGS